ncbi:hypothetical protein PM082_015404 [Marasmius tenuissimus]|nr:hypothetical protein PM082_015404 [Marasmius tenuissimus]
MGMVESSSSNPMAIFEVHITAICAYLLLNSSELNAASEFSSSKDFWTVRPEQRRSYRFVRYQRFAGIISPETSTFCSPAEDCHRNPSNPAGIQVFVSAIIPTTLPRLRFSTASLSASMPISPTSLLPPQPTILLSSWCSAFESVTACVPGVIYCSGRRRPVP